jgi:pimeloyl-ACP methyl ester carboxylesterase
LTVAVLFLATGCSSIERRLLFYPSHRPANGALTPWTADGKIVGFSRKVESPGTVWLMLPGNGGQASDRAYAIPSFRTTDSVFILEYPGYGERVGVPSRESFNRAAKDAYFLLRSAFPKTPVCVVGESIGTGAAASLARLSPPPDKVVLIVPFDELSLVGKDHLPSFVVDLILKDDWDNLAALKGYKGPIDIFGAESDTVIPVKHARALAAALPSSKFTLIPGGHNDWSQPGRVRITNP